MYQFYSCLGFVPIKQNKKLNDIHKEEFNRIHHSIENIVRVNHLEHGFDMYDLNILVGKQDIINFITHSFIPVYFCQINKYVTKFTNYDMISTFEVYRYHKMEKCSLGQNQKKFLNLILMRTIFMILILWVLKTKGGKLDEASMRLNEKFENTYEIEIQNGMSCIHDNKVNNIAECNLLHDKLNTSKRTKI